MPDDFSPALAARADAGALDQASTLRSLFARPTCALLPVLVPGIHDVARTRWLAQLAQALARSGRRTLAIDAARLQVAAFLGLRARFDLLHVLRGECPLAAAALASGPDLAVLPAARAFETADAERIDVFALVEAAIGSETAFDLVLLMLPPEPATRLAAGLAGSEWLLPILPNGRDLASLLAAARATAEGMNAALAAAVGTSAALAGARCQDGVTTVFRSLFLGMEETSAATLAQRMAVSAQLRASADLHIELKFGGAVRTGRDLARVVQSAAGWDLAQLTLPQTENLESLS